MRTLVAPNGTSSSRSTGLDEFSGEAGSGRTVYAGARSLVHSGTRRPRQDSLTAGGAVASKGSAGSGPARMKEHDSRSKPVN